MRMYHTVQTAWVLADFRTEASSHHLSAGEQESFLDSGGWLGMRWQQWLQPHSFFSFWQGISSSFKKMPLNWNRQLLLPLSLSSLESKVCPRLPSSSPIFIPGLNGGVYGSPGPLPSAPSVLINPSETQSGVHSSLTINVQRV